MKQNSAVIRITFFIIPLALFATCMGIFWQGTGEPYPFTTLRGEIVMIRGHGLYRYDTISSSSQMIGQDIVTLLVGVPLLIAGVLWSRKGSLRGKLLLTGGLGYFLYTYASMSFLAAFNILFLVYVALFSLSLIGFIMAFSELDPNEVVNHVSDRFPQRTVSAYFLVVAAFLTIAWLGLVVPPMLSGTPPAGLESATTMVIQAFDLGVIVPTSVITVYLLSRRYPWGIVLSSVLLLKLLTMGAALISMIVVQMLAGVPVDLAVSAIFALISLSGIILAVMTLRTIKD